MNNARLHFACPIYFLRDQSSNKLIIFLNLTYLTQKSQLASQGTPLDRDSVLKNFKDWELRLKSSRKIDKITSAQSSQLASESHRTFESSTVYTRK